MQSRGREGRANTFAGTILDRVSEHRDDAAWVAARLAEPDTRFIVVGPSGETLKIANGDGLLWLDDVIRQQHLAHLPPTLLGIANGRAHFMLTADAELMNALADSAAATPVDLRRAGLSFDAFDAGLFAYAKGLAHWQNETRHCAYCGATGELLASGHRLQCTNEACGRLHFPRTDAAIIVIVEHEGACLLGRQRSWPPGRFSTLAGFIEPGESLEDAVRREVAEEAGVEVLDVHYHSSQPWPMPASLMVGFTAFARSREIRYRDQELEEARWFTPEDIREGIADGSLLVSPSVSVSYRLLEHWLADRGHDLGAMVAAGTR
jgi:NAD+ diphosphatase